jgi:hypothetical protein
VAQHRAQHRCAPSSHDVNGLEALVAAPLRRAFLDLLFVDLLLVDLLFVDLLFVRVEML